MDLPVTLHPPVGNFALAFYYIKIIHSVLLVLTSYLISPLLLRSIEQSIVGHHIPPNQRQ